MSTVGTLECRTAERIATAILIVETNDVKDGLEAGTKGLVESCGLRGTIGLVGCMGM